MVIHRLINWALALAVVALLAAVQTLDASDFETEAEAERREWMAAVSVCHRAYGPSTQPEYADNGQMICRTRRGQELPYRVAAK
jgi:hypothetical protein